MSIVSSSQFSPNATTKAVVQFVEVFRQSSFLQRLSLVLSVCREPRRRVCPKPVSVFAVVVDGPRGG
eukprot:4137519-Lingulodinium_polyedra.AAC.2